MNLTFILNKIDKVEHHVRIKTHKLIIVRL